MSFRIITASILTVLLVLLLAGCGTPNEAGSTDTKQTNKVEKAEKEPEKEAQSLVLVETGETAKDSDGDVYMTCGFVIENPNEDTAFEYPTVTVTAYDANGEVLATEEQTMMTIQPKEKQAFVIWAVDCNGEIPEKVEYDLDSGNIIEPSDDAILSSEFEISGTNERKDEYGETSITGIVKNTSSNDTDDTAVIVLFRKDGRIVSGAMTYVENLSAGKDKAFEINEYDVPEHDSFEVSAVNWAF